MPSSPTVGTQGRRRGAVASQCGCGPYATRDGLPIPPEVQDRAGVA